MMLAGLASPAQWADIGAGIGIASRQLADGEVTIIAIEPDPQMLQMAQAYPLVTYQQATATTQIPNQSMDIMSGLTSTLL